MATYTVDKIEYNSNVYVLQDSGALQLTGGQVTGPVTFGNSISVDEATMGDLVVNGNASFTNNIQANTINGVEVGTNPKFTDTNTVTTVSTTGSGNAVTAVTASNGALTVTKGTTFLTSHQDISGKADKSATVSTVAYDSTNQKITKTINGTTSDVVTVATLKTALGSMPASDVYSWAKASTKPTYTASEVGAVPTTRTVNGHELSDDIADADYVTYEGTTSSWNYRKWASGKIEAWHAITFSSASSSVWASPVRYMDKTFTIPIAIFGTGATMHVIATSPSNQYWVVGASASYSGSSLQSITGSLRIATVASGSMATAANIYVWTD